MKISKSDKEILLFIADRAIKEKINPQLDQDSSLPAITKVLESKCGAFVSLYVDKKLRGCIGTFSEEEPLYENVTRMAVSAALSDTRFNSIVPEELSRLEIEISILTPRVRIYDPEDIEIGKHGIYISQGSNRGTLLPQVAVNKNWSVEEFLGNCARHKAGIGWKGWKNAEIYTYEALVFTSDLTA
jgi:MEMO1 family protein